MDSPGISVRFHKLLEEDAQMSATVAAIHVLIEVVENTKAETLTEFFKILDDAKKTLMNTDSAVPSVSSGCELFVRFITLNSKELEIDDFQSIKEVLLKRSKTFLDKIHGSRRKIAQFANQFIIDGSKILVHSYSRVVLNTLKVASECKHFHVYVTESSPDKSGERMFRDICQLGIDATLILDAAVGYIMEKVDFVMVGAEAVVESGGIINKIGTYTLAMCARRMNKPVYVLAESFKFLRLYPLNQQDLPSAFLFRRTPHNSDQQRLDPLVDYTSQHYITLLFSDLGILTPSAVSDELIKLYQ